MTASFPRLTAGPNVNMAGGPVTVEVVPDSDPPLISGLIEGDPFLQKQNELSLAVSSRNPRHLLAGANDYRTVPLPGAVEEPVPGLVGAGDVWLGWYTSLDQGKRWRSTLLPGYPQDDSLQGLASPLKGFEAAADPIVRAGSNGLFYYCGIVFDRGESAQGAVFCARAMDLNNLEGVDFPLAVPEANPADPRPRFASPIQYIDATLIDTGNAGQFLDKINGIVDRPRGPAKLVDVKVPLNCSKDPLDPASASCAAADGNGDGFIDQSIPCGHAYVGYADFTGNPNNNPTSKILISRTTDCGSTWGAPALVNQSQKLSQSVTLGIRDEDGRVSVAWREFGVGGDPDAIWIAHQDMKSKNKFKFLAAILVAELSPLAAPATGPLDLATRAADGFVDAAGENIDPFRGARVNSYPTLAVDAGGRYYLAWAQKGWGADVDGDGIADGARIVLKTSADGQNWSLAAKPVDDSGSGHQIMPSMQVIEGRLELLFYDFRDDIYPAVLNQVASACGGLVACCQAAIAGEDAPVSGVTNDDCTNLGLPGFLESLAPLDPIGFEPLPIRHTVDTYLVEMELGPDPTGSNHVTKVSNYPQALVPSSGPEGIELAQLQFNHPFYSLFQGEKAFLGDYLEIAGEWITTDSQGNWALNLIPPDCSNGFGNCASSAVAHGAWGDNRDVQPPPPADASSTELQRLDWESPYIGIAGRANMLDQNPYTARLSGGVVLSSPGNFKPLFEFEVPGPTPARSFALVLENTLREGFIDPVGPKWVRQARRYRLTFDLHGASNIEASFTPFSVDPANDTLVLDVTVQSQSSVAVTLFVRLTKDVTPSAPRIIVYANEIDAAGAVFDGGLQARVVLNADDTNPIPLNIDTNLMSAQDVESHTPAFVPFNCGDFLDLIGGEDPDTGEPAPDGHIDEPALLEVFPSCEAELLALADGMPVGEVDFSDLWPTFVTLQTQWPALFLPGEQVLNASLFNASLFNASLFNPAIFTASLFNPALLNQDLLIAQNASLFNASLFNASLFNASLFNASLFNASLFNASLFNASLFNASLFNASLFNASLFNDAVNASLFNASLFNASLFNASLFNASLFNSALNGQVNGASSLVKPANQVYNAAPFSSIFTDPEAGDGASLFDWTWELINIGNSPSNYFFNPLVATLAGAPEGSQFLLRKVYSVKRAVRDPDCIKGQDPSTCGLRTFDQFQTEILANILDLPSYVGLDPSVLGDLLLQATATLNSGERLFATLRIPDLDGPGGGFPGCQFNAAGICVGGIDPDQVQVAVVPQAPDEEGLIGTWIVVDNLAPNPAVFGEPALAVSAVVGSYSGDLPIGSVQFSVSTDAGATFLAVGAPATLTGSPSVATLSLNVPDSLNAGSYQVKATYLPGDGFGCGFTGMLSADDDFVSCDSQLVDLVVTPLVVGQSAFQLGSLDDFDPQNPVCRPTNVVGNTITATFDSNPFQVCAEGDPSLSLSPEDITISYSGTDNFGNFCCAAGETPTNAGQYVVTITINNSNVTGSFDVILVIGRADQTVDFLDGAVTFPDTLAGVLIATAVPPTSETDTTISYHRDTETGAAVTGTDTLDVSGSPYTIVAVASETANYNSDDDPAQITVNKGTLDFSFPGGGPLTYPQTLGAAGVLNAVITTADTGSTVSYFRDPVLPANEVVAGTVLDASLTPYTVIAVASATPNYNSAELSVSITVDKGAQTVDFADGAVIFPNAVGSALNATVSVPGPDTTTGAVAYALAATTPDGAAGMSIDELTVLDAGTYHVTATAAATLNYEEDSATATISVNAGSQIVTFSGGGPLTYAETLSSVLNATVAPPTSETGATISYHLSTFDGAVVTGPDILNASGTPYTIVAVASATNNYNSDDDPALITVNRGSQTVSFVGGTVTFGNPIGPVLNATATPSGPDPVTGAISYALGDGTVVDASTLLPPGSHQVTATAAQTGNYNVDSSTATITVEFVTFIGFGPPVGAAGDPSEPNSVPFAGSFGTNKTLTLKWELFQAGVEVSDLDFIHSIEVFPVAQSGNSCVYPATPPASTTLLYPTCSDTNVCAGGTELRSGDQYVFNWKLSSVPSGCWGLKLNLGQAGDPGSIFKTKAVTVKVR